MKFVNDANTGSKVIKDRFPEFANCQLVGDGSGWDNYAIIVNNEYLFRFPRRQESLDQIRQEAEVLDILHAKLPKYIEVPKYLAANLDDDYPFVYYKMIQGQPLTKELYDGFTEEEKDRFIKYMVEFLHILHSIDIKSCKSLEKVNALGKYQDFYQKVTEVCLKYLTPDEQCKTKQIFDRYLQDISMQNYIPAAVHGDLSENHILITKNGIGVIDFGDTSIFDPAIDLCWFYLLDHEMFHRITTEYLSHEDMDFERRITQFYVPIIPYYGIIFGEESDNPKQIEDELNDLRHNLAAM